MDAGASASTMSSAKPAAVIVPGAAVPNQPDQWAERDHRFAAHVVLAKQQAVARQGTPPCACGGNWRYVLVPRAHRPLWRCLHCGALYLGDRLILEEMDPTAV